MGTVNRRLNNVIFGVILISVSIDTCFSQYCGELSDNVTISDFGTWRCGLYIANAKGEDMHHVHTMKKLPGNNSNARCAIKGILSDPTDWDALTEKCKKFLAYGLEGEFRLEKPLPKAAKNSSNVSGDSDEMQKTIGDTLCTTVIKKHVCGYQYHYCLSTCGSEFLDIGIKGPEPICCKQVSRKEFKHVPCSEWRPFVEGRPIPGHCKDFVKKEP